MFCSSFLSGMGTCRTLLAGAVSMSSSSVCIRNSDPWPRSGSAVVLWLVWAPCSSSSSISTPTTAVCSPSFAVQTSQRTLSCYVSLHLCSFTADSFETMLKSLLGYHSGGGGASTENIIRKKVYQGAIDTTLKNNFPLVLKVRL